MPPARSSAQDFRRGGDEEEGLVVVVVVYGARRGWRRKSVAVSCVRKEVPA